ncbi:MAG TPA: hypothetical protein VGI64_17850 [Streptosporangiaceae bacterium]|jgi:hypothetical protein
MPEFHRPKYVYVEPGGGAPVALIAAGVATVAAVVWLRAHLGEIEFVAAVVVASAVVSVASCAVASRLLYKRLCKLETQPVSARHNPARVIRPGSASRPVQARTAPRALRARSAITPAMVELAQAIRAVEDSR